MTVMPPPSPPPPKHCYLLQLWGGLGLQGLPGHSARERAAAFMTSRLWEVKTVENLNFLGYSVLLFSPTLWLTLSNLF